MSIHLKIEIIPLPELIQVIKDFLESNNQQNIMGFCPKIHPRPFLEERGVKVELKARKINAKDYIVVYPKRQLFINVSNID